MNTLFDLLLAPFAVLSPIWGLTLISALAGVVLVLLYGRVSNQRKLREVKRAIGAALYESILFRRDLGVSLRAQARMLKGAGHYFVLALPPLAILLVPCILLLAQLQVRYGVRPLTPSESTVVAVKLTDSQPLKGLALQADGSIEATAPVRIPSLHESIWRITPHSTGTFNISIPAVEITQPIEVGQEVVRLRPLTSRSFWDKLLYPSDLTLPPLIESIEVAYPERSYAPFGVTMHWVIMFFIVSLASGLVAAKVFHIEV